MIVVPIIVDKEGTAHIVAYFTFAYGQLWTRCEQFSHMSGAINFVVLERTKKLCAVCKSSLNHGGPEPQ